MMMLLQKACLINQKAIYYITKELVYKFYRALILFKFFLCSLICYNIMVLNKNHFNSGKKFGGGYCVDDNG